MGRNRLPSLCGRSGPPPSWPASTVDFARWLGYAGEILVLFETPSGFAVFNYNGVLLYAPRAIEKIWSDFAKDYVAREVIVLKDFQTFENKADAITPAGVSDRLKKMIMKWIRPSQSLAVGKVEHKAIIEKHLQVRCLFDEAVMELMWGLKNLMKFLVPGEVVELTMEDRLPMSYGLRSFLRMYDFHVEPEMVNAEIIELAFGLYECDQCEVRHYETLQCSADILKEVSGIDAKNWSLLKIASALKVICYPEEEFEYVEILSDDELSQLVAEAPKFTGKFFKKKCLGVYNAIVRAHRVKFTALRRLRYLVDLRLRMRGPEEGLRCLAMGEPPLEIV